MLCIPQEQSAKLKEAARKDEIKVAELIKMSQSNGWSYLANQLICHRQSFWIEDFNELLKTIGSPDLSISRSVPFISTLYLSVSAPVHTVPIPYNTNHATQCRFGTSQNNSLSVLPRKKDREKLKIIPPLLSWFHHPDLFYLMGYHSSLFQVYHHSQSC